MKIRGYRFVERTNEAQIKKAASTISAAKRPVILAGGGIVISKACKEFQKFAERLRIPVVSTMTGLGVLPCDHPLYYGMIGSHGKKQANQLLSRADLVVVLGARLGDRSIANTKGLERRAKLIHVDIDPAEIGKNLKADVPVVGDLKYVLSRLIPFFADYEPPQEWISSAEETRHISQRRSDKIRSGLLTIIAFRIRAGLLPRLASEPWATDSRQPSEQRRRVQNA